jgi:repressor of nif and glnA expression
VIGDGYQTHNSPTLDRICNGRGYVKGNVRVISWRANSLKRDANIEEIRSILKYMENTEKSTH